MFGPSVLIRGGTFNLSYGIQEIIVLLCMLIIVTNSIHYGRV
jgi:hypothetical protein